MNIRSITIGINPEHLNERNLFSKIVFLRKEIEKKLEKKNIQIKTFRLTLSPINLYNNFSEPYVRSILSNIEDLNKKIDFRWYCVPYQLNNNFSTNHLSLKSALSTLKHFKNSFVNLVLADNFDSKFFSELGGFNKKVSLLANNGFCNFRVGVSCNIKPNTPFFPFSYHQGDDFSFSVALESLEYILSKIENVNFSNVLEFEKYLLKILDYQLVEFTELFKEISYKTNINFSGLDSSLAPYPENNISVPHLIEKIGQDNFGSNGTLTITSFLTNLIKKAINNKKIMRVGFNGVMFSLLEDHLLAQRNNQRNFNIDSLLLYSSVCGCGLDMIPVPGSIMKEEIGSIISDTLSLAIKLNKPLGVRLLPIPGKEEYEMTSFNHDFLVDSRIMPVKNMSLNLF